MSLASSATLGTPEGVAGPMTKDMKSYGSKVPVFVVSQRLCRDVIKSSQVKNYSPGNMEQAPSDVDGLSDVIASALTADHIYCSSSPSALRRRGTCTSTVSGRRGAMRLTGDWPAFDLTAARDLTDHGPRRPAAEDQTDEEE